MRNPFYTLPFKFVVVRLKRDASRCKSVEDYVALVSAREEPVCLDFSSGLINHFGGYF
jgi:hypothetical protein